MNTVKEASTQTKNGLFQMPKVIGLPLASATLLSVSVVGAVFAEGDGLTEFKKRLYINGGIGLTHIEPWSPSDSLTISDNADAGGHLALGYDFNRFLTIEGYAADLGTSQVAFLGADVGSIDYQVFGLTALGYLYNTQSGSVFRDSDVDGLFRREGLSLYGRFGVGHMTNSSEGVQYYQDYPNHVAYGLGLEYGFTNGFAVRTELMAMDTDAKYLNIGILKRFGKPQVPAVLAVPAVVVPDAPKVAVTAPAPAPLTVEAAPMSTPQGNFAFDKAIITQKFARDLDELAAVLIKNDVGIRIKGHTDWIGSERYNMTLSERRAAAVQNYLLSRGVKSLQLETRGYGETQPIADNTTVQGRAINRRVEIELQ